FPHSLGLLYSAFTYFTGFRVNSGEYKVMGLAPYGEPRYVRTIKDHLLEIRDDGSVWMNMEYFTYPHALTMTGRAFERLFDGAARRAAGAGGGNRRAARAGEGGRVVPGADGVRAARARRPVDHRRRTLAPHAVDDEPENQVPRVVPAVRPVGAARARRLVVRA